MSNDNQLSCTTPIAPLGVIPMKSCRSLGDEVNDYLVSWRGEREKDRMVDAANASYKKHSCIVDADTPRFGSGEGKGMINQSIRGLDLYLLTDVTNWNCTYKLCGRENHYSPSDHYADLKRIIAATNGKAKRINVIMPFLYEGRQHKRSGRESLDCALMLQELVDMGVDNIITFDAHDPRVQNAIPLHGFESVPAYYQFIKNILRNVDDLQIDNDHLMIVSPDEGATQRAVYLASVLGVDMGI